MIEKFNHVRSKAIRNAAKGEDCTICGNNNGTTVFAHLNEQWAGKGMGIKADDIAGFFACDVCHSDYDGGFFINGHDLLMRAYYRTIRRLWDRGIIGELK